MSKAAKSRPRLGRGLSSLISVSDLPVEAELPAGEARDIRPPESADRDSGAGALAPATATPPPVHAPAEIPLERMKPNPHQPRRSMNDASIAELAASLKSNGVIQPVIVRRVGEEYQLIAGERRWRAAKLAGLETIPAIVRDVDGLTQAQMALVENIQREDLNPIDRAQGYRALLDQLGLTQAELANRLGEDRSSIANFTRLLDLAEPVRRLVRDGKLSVGHAKLLAGVDDLLEQERLANLVVNQELSVRNLERLLQTGQPPKVRAEASASEPSAHIKDLEQSLTRQLGMRCQLRAAKKGRGRLVIHYNSLDQFDDLLGRLGVQAE